MRTQGDHVVNDYKSLVNHQALCGQEITDVLYKYIQDIVPFGLYLG